MNKPKTTKEAFDELIHIRGIHNRLDMTSESIRSLRNRFKNNLGISVDKMEEILTKAGYEVVQEKLWGGN